MTGSGAVGDEGEPIRVPILYRLGWFRWLPHAALDFEEILHRFPGASREEAVAVQRIWHARRAGTELDRSLAPEEIAAGLPPAPAWEDLEEDDAEGLALHNDRVAAYDAMTTRMGLAPVRTADQVLDLMVSVGLAEVSLDNARQVLRLVAHPPLPTEVLPLTPDERAKEDRQRWQSRYDRLSQKVLGLFIDDEAGDLARTTLPSTLDRLASMVAADVEDVRQAVLVLLDEGDFAAERHGDAVDVERLLTHQRFDLVVDPDRFYADRVSLRLTRPVERPDA